MSKKERAARALERKIHRAIERGEFTPDYGYLSNKSFVSKDGRHLEVEIGPCGCALAAAGTVNGIKAAKGGYSGHDQLVSFLRRKAGVAQKDSNAMEHGYEQFSYPFYDPSSPYHRLGKRLRRFHPSSRNVE